MIQINILQDVGGTFGGASRNTTHERKKSSTGSRPLLTAFLSLFVVVGLALCYLLFAGVPAPVAPFIPEVVSSTLGLSLPPSIATPTETPTTVADVSVTNTSLVKQPASPSYNSVEEIVQTVRPDMFYKRERKEYRQMLPAEKIVHQKIVMAAAFSLFRAITPQNFGFTDLVFKIPDYFYARGLASDDPTMKVFLDSLKHRSTEFKLIPTGNSKKPLEFSAYGRLNIPETAAGDNLALMTPAEVVQELTKLQDLAQLGGVKFLGLDNPELKDYGLYRRVVYHAQTKADFPSLQQFVNSLRSANLRVGILQVSMRPALDETPVSVFDFVVYTTPK